MRSRTLRRYLLRRVGWSVLGALLGLVLVAWALQIVRVAPEVLTDATPAALVLRVVLLPLVPLAGFVLPVALALGLLVVGRRLAVEGVFDALTAGGVAPRSLAQPFLGLTLLATLASAGLSLIGEPLALGELRAAAPELAASAFEGRITPGSFAAAGPGLEVYAGARTGESWRNVLIVRRQPSDGTAEVAARELRATAGVHGRLALELRGGALRATNPDGTTTATFGSLRLPLDVGALRARVEAMLPAGLAAPPAAVLDARWLAAASERDRYLVLRRWAAPLQTLLFGLLAMALALGRAGMGRTIVLAAVAVFGTHALLRVLEPLAAAGTWPAWAALLLPHLPAALLAAIATRRLYLTRGV